MKKKLYTAIGLMSGTSMDGIDAERGIIIANKVFSTVSDYKIEIIIKDQKSDPLLDKEMTSELIMKYKVKAIIGWEYSSHAFGGTPIAEKHKIPGICIYATNPLVTKGKKYISRVVFDDNFQGKVAAQYMFNDLKIRNVGVIRDTSQEYSIGLTSIFEHYFRGLGGNIVKTYNINSRSNHELVSLRYATEQIINDGVKNIYMPIYSKEIAEILLLLSSHDKQFLFFSSDSTGFTPNYLGKNVSLCEGLYYTDQYYAQDANKMTEFFNELYDKYYPSTPKNTISTHLAFDAYYLLYNAIKSCVDDKKSPTSENINYYVRHTKDLLVTTGIISINPETGSAIRPAYILKLSSKGKPLFVKKVMFDAKGK
jgi:branched-chain amino acid transport system substrate-binding protein